MNYDVDQLMEDVLWWKMNAHNDNLLLFLEVYSSFAQNINDKSTKIRLFPFKSSLKSLSIYRTITLRWVFARPTALGGSLFLDSTLRRSRKCTLPSESYSSKSSRRPKMEEVWVMATSTLPSYLTFGINYLGSSMAKYCLYRIIVSKGLSGAQLRFLKPRFLGWIRAW